MYGVIDGFYVCNLDQNNELNQRIFERNIPSQTLEPSFSSRPVSTKYTLLPIIDTNVKSSVPLKNYARYNTSQIFNPGTAQAPWNGFATNINLESSLRNQFFALQKANQAYYVPSSSSDLYNSNLLTNKDSESHKSLFKKEEFNSFNPNPNIQIVGTSIFNNNTRCQVKNLSC